MQTHTKFKLTVNDASYEYYNRFITGAELRKLASIENDSLIFLKIEGIDEPVQDNEKVDLARLGIECFYTVKKKPKFKFTLNSKMFDWERFITGKELRKLGHIPPEEDVFLKIQGKDEEIQNDEKVDLARLGIEHFYSKKKQPRLVEIKINNKEYQIKPGAYTVAEIKKLGNVPAAHELEQLIDGKLTPLDDNATVTIKGCEQFFSHVRDGSSS